MTKPEFNGPYQRLCTRFKLEPSDEQARIWYQRFGQRYPLSVWNIAVDHLVAEMRSPLADHVFKAVDGAAEHHRRIQCAQEKCTAPYVLHQAAATGNECPEPIRASLDYAKAQACGFGEALHKILSAWCREHPEDARAQEALERITKQ